LERDGWKASTIDQAVKPSARPGSVIRDLLDAGFISAKDHGWIVIDPMRASGLILAKGSA
jgi:hypothetical protein